QYDESNTSMNETNGANGINLSQKEFEKIREGIWKKMVDSMATNDYLCNKLNKEWKDMKSFLKQHLLTHDEWVTVKYHPTMLKHLKARFRRDLQNQSVSAILLMAIITSNREFNYERMNHYLKFSDKFTLFVVHFYLIFGGYSTSWKNFAVSRGGIKTKK
ncbi:hypothetical protein RFI_19049, partial [Reticulomyxa filosa]